MMKRDEFVQRCGELLRIAKPNLVNCEYRLGKDIPKSHYEHYIDEEEYVVITCENGHKYVRPITGNSLIAIATEIFCSMTHK